MDQLREVIAKAEYAAARWSVSWEDATESMRWKYRDHAQIIVDALKIMATSTHHDRGRMHVDEQWVRLGCLEKPGATVKDPNAS